MTEQEYSKVVGDIFLEEMSRKSPCMCIGCNSMAKNSHVLQEAMILRPIAPQSHMYLMEYWNIYTKKSLLKYVRRGIGDILSYQGFCAEHDNKLFKPIESSSVDWNTTQSQYLLAYRTLCREVDIKDRALKFYKRLGVQKEDTPVWVGLEVAKYNKRLIEEGVFKANYSHYQFETIELDFLLELCVAASITIVDDPNKLVSANQVEPNIVIVFPFKGKTIIIVGYREEFENLWTHNFLNELRASKQRALKALNDLILYRTEFSAMSESLYGRIEKNELEKFISEYNKEGKNFSNQLSSDINIFASARL